MIKVGIIGTGNMGEAIIRGLSGQRKKFSIFVCEKDKKRFNKISKRYRLKKCSIRELTKVCEIIIICVKPQEMDSLLKELKSVLAKNIKVISIAAGVTTPHIEKILGKAATVLRVMPNLPGLIGRGVSAYCLGKKAAKRDAEITEKIFKTIGKVLRIKENKMDAVTAISGSGPGFLAYITASLEEAALDVGLSKEQARLLSVSTIAGTGSLLEMGFANAKELAKRVASKGGTTQAGIKEFKKRKMKSIIKKAAFAAVKRAKELNK